MLYIYIITFQILFNSLAHFNGPVAASCQKESGCHISLPDGGESQETDGKTLANAEASQRAELSDAR